MNILVLKLLALTTLGAGLAGSGLARLVLRRGSPSRAAWRIMLGVGVVMSGIGAPGGVPGVLGGVLSIAGPAIAVASVVGDYRRGLAIRDAGREPVPRG